MSPVHGQTGGLSFPEDGGPINGTAQAGQAAVARDAQTAWLNPAGMTRLERPEFMVTLQPFNIGMEFNQTTGTSVIGTNGGDAGGWFPSGGLFLAAPVSDRWAFGFSITAPSGLALDYDNNWVGRYYTTRVQLVVLNIEPSVAFKINDNWSLGAGLDIQYANFEQDLAVNLPGPVDGSALISGDSWQVGFSLSVLWQPLETTRFGLRYRSEMDHSLSGDLVALTATAPVDTSLLLPQSLTFSAYHDFNDTVALLADIGWQNWSAFERTIIAIDGGAGTQVEIPRNFKDTFGVGLGFHMRPAEKWLLMAGASYASSAVSDADRSPDLPVDRQIRLSVGLEYEINEAWTVGGNFTWIDLGANNLDFEANANQGRVTGFYDPANMYVLGIYGAYRF